MITRKAIIACVSAFISLGAWGLYQSHQLGRAEMAKETAAAQRDSWQAEAEKLRLELEHTRAALSVCGESVDLIRRQAEERAREARQAKDQANAMARERDAAVTRWRASEGASCADAMPMVREALGL